MTNERSSTASGLNDAPEKIWARTTKIESGSWDDCHMVTRRSWSSVPSTNATEYIRADHAQAELQTAVAAEREACAELVAEYENHRSWADWASLYSAIRARGNVDPLAARDARELGDSFFALCVQGTIEADRAMRKFPQPNYVISKVAEEAGEVVKAAIHCAEDRESAREVRTEMKQLIAMLYRLWVEGDQVHGLPPLIPTDKGELG